MSEYGVSARHATRSRPHSAGLRTPHLAALLLSSHPPLTSLWLVVPTAYGISQVVATPLVFGFAGLILIGFVVGYSGLGRRARHSGGLYVQVTAGLGRSVGLGAAALLFCSYVGLVAAAYGLAAVVLKAAISTTFGVDLPMIGLLLVTVVLIQGLSLVSLRILSTALIVAIGIQFLIVAWMALVASTSVHSPVADTSSTDALDPGFLLSGSFFVGLILALTGFAGSEGATAYSGELANPNRAIPRATYLSYVLTTAVLFLGAWAISGIVGPEVAVPSAGAYQPLAIFTALVGSSAGAPVLHLLGFAAYLGVLTTGVSLNSNAARQLTGLARDGVLPRIFVASDAPTAPPARAAFVVQPVLAGVVALLAALSPPNLVPLWIAMGSGLGVLAVLALASAAAAMWFLSGEADESGFLGWEGQVIAGVFALVLIGSVFVYGVTHIEQAAPGSPAVASWLVGVVIAGVFGVGVLTAQYLRARRPAVYAAIGGPRVREERVAPVPVPSGAL